MATLETFLGLFDSLIGSGATGRMKTKYIAAHLLFFARLAVFAQIETTPIEKPHASALLWNNQGVYLGDDPKTIDNVLQLKSALDRHRAHQINYPIFVGTLNATGTNVLIVIEGRRWYPHPVEATVCISTIEAGSRDVRRQCEYVIGNRANVSDILVESDRGMIALKIKPFIAIDPPPSPFFRTFRFDRTNDCSIVDMGNGAEPWTRSVPTNLSISQSSAKVTRRTPRAGQETNDE